MTSAHYAYFFEEAHRGMGFDRIYVTEYLALPSLSQQPRVTEPLILCMNAISALRECRKNRASCSLAIVFYG